MECKLVTTPVQTRSPLTACKRLKKFKFSQVVNLLLTYLRLTCTSHVKWKPVHETHEAHFRHQLQSQVNTYLVYKRLILTKQDDILWSPDSMDKEYHWLILKKQTIQFKCFSIMYKMLQIYNRFYNKILWATLFRSNSKQNIFHIKINL